jgi:hypothetical protein
MNESVMPWRIHALSIKSLKCHRAMDERRAIKALLRA